MIRLGSALVVTLAVVLWSAPRPAAACGEKMTPRARFKLKVRRGARITVVSFGEERPEFTPATSGRNRRVVILVD